MTTTIWAILALLLLPALLLAWLTESRRERVHRLRRAGWSQQRIADHLGVSRYRVRVLLQPVN
jgi:DNA-binding CsgD family transcriptional regulator